MHVTKKQLEPTKISLDITAGSEELANIKQKALASLAKDLRLPGFRAGKAPLNLVEKSVEPSRLQSEFLDLALNQFYVEAVGQQKLSPVDQPDVSITKFVPFNTLEFKAEVEVVGEIKLPDYKKIKLARKPVSVSDKDVVEVLDQLKKREAEKKEVKRDSKDGDEVLIDFRGIDTKTKEPIQGADGDDYPLVLGSNTFIPGFEPELIGLKAGGKKTFDIVFPKDYGVKALQNRKVTFTVTVKQVQELVEPQLDDKFASKVGPFKTLDDLKADIKNQLASEREREAERDYENELIEKIADKTEIAVPEALIDEQLDSMDQDERQNLAYRGQTWQEHLKEEGVSEEQHRAKNRSQAEKRVRAGLALSEISEKEGIEVTPEELEIRMQLLKGQYKDKEMQAELEKPQTRREILSRMLTEKTLDKLKTYATA